MPQPEEFDAKILPDQELNPLANPLLAANLGRWAEVYFTTPPEKRAQAIHELLRELENSSPPEPPSSQAIHNERAREKTETADASPSEPALTCIACSHDNPPGQRFCGMCGAPLPILSEVDEPQVVDTFTAAEVSLNEPELSPGTDSVDHVIDRALYRESHDAIVSEPLAQNDFPSFAVESESRPHRYRFHVGIVLATLLAVLVYVAWRGTDALPGGAAPHAALSKAVPAEQTQPANSALQPAARPSVTDTAPAPTSATPASVAPAANRQRAAARSVVPASARSPEVAAGQSGAEELAMAENYLAGNLGAGRNSREAAQWLWKAVGKGNLAATVALSDLYLRGDGVLKSCDQGRLLLDAAARKGGKAAAERLRNMQAFGCQ